MDTSAPFICSLPLFVRTPDAYKNGPITCVNRRTDGREQWEVWEREQIATASVTQNGNQNPFLAARRCFMKLANCFTKYSNNQSLHDVLACGRWR